jgi:hypothetical protein
MAILAMNITGKMPVPRLVGAGLALPMGTPRGAPTKGVKRLPKKQEFTILQCRSMRILRSSAVFTWS